MKVKYRGLSESPSQAQFRHATTRGAAVPRREASSNNNNNNPLPLGRRLGPHPYLVRTREGLPSLTLPLAVHIPSAALPGTASEGSAILFNHFFPSEFWSHMRTAQKLLFREICRFLVAPVSIFDDLGSQNRSPGPTFSVFFRKR